MTLLRHQPVGEIRRTPGGRLTRLTFPVGKSYATFLLGKLRSLMDVPPLEARAALDTVEKSRLRVIDEIGLPQWYWWGLALGWIVLGWVTDLNYPWLTAVATLLFGAVHSAVAPRVINGRHRSNQLSVNADIVDRHLPALVLGGLIILAGITVAGAVAISADGAQHPVTITSIFVAVVIVLGGPRLLAAVRRRAVRSSARR
jgi:hypothetical protein